jgi:hypothetical protein
VAFAIQRTRNGDRLRPIPPRGQLPQCVVLSGGDLVVLVDQATKDVHAADRGGSTGRCPRFRIGTSYDPFFERAHKSARENRAVGGGGAVVVNGPGKGWPWWWSRPGWPSFKAVSSSLVETHRLRKLLLSCMPTMKWLRRPDVRAARNATQQSPHCVPNVEQRSDWIPAGRGFQPPGLGTQGCFPTGQVRVRAQQAGDQTTSVRLPDTVRIANCLAASSRVW